MLLIRVQLLKMPTSSVASEYKVYALPSYWDPINIINALIALIQDEKPDNLDRDHMDALYAAVCCGKGIKSSRAHVDVLLKSFLEVKDYLYVALCDEELCAHAVEILYVWIVFLGEPAVKTFPTLLNCLKMLYPAGPVSCQNNVLGLLKRWFDAGDATAQGVLQLKKVRLYL